MAKNSNHDSSSSRTSRGRSSMHDGHRSSSGSASRSRSSSTKSDRK